MSRIDLPHAHAGRCFGIVGLLLVLAVAGLPACKRPASEPTLSPPSAATKNPAPSAATPAPTNVAVEKRPSVAAMTALGRQLFADPQLSATGNLSCASCHDPAFRYGPADARPVHFGGADLSRPGLRAIPSLTYRQTVPPFNEHFFDDDGNDSEDQGPTGGLDWDGRVDTAHEQAAGPLFSPFEMANTDAKAIVAKVQQGPHAAQFRETFGEHVFDDSDRAFKALLTSLEVFQQSPGDFYPYTSKFDAVLRHQASFTPREAKGFALFNDQRKGNCASCHISAVKNGAFPAFTDHGLIAIGVPRNPHIPANKDPAYFDLGLCGPLRQDLKDHADYCGRFRTPSLRNVTLRKVFFHNGVYHNLDQVMRFYVQRDTDPGKFYPRSKDGKVRKFDDLPEAYWANVNDEAPFDRKPGEKPALTEAEIQDVIVFLGTLTDGYVPPPASAAGAP